MLHRVPQKTLEEKRKNIWLVSHKRHGGTTAAHCCHLGSPVKHIVKTESSVALEGWEVLTSMHGRAYERKRHSHLHTHWTTSPSAGCKRTLRLHGHGQKSGCSHPSPCYMLLQMLNRPDLTVFLNDAQKHTQLSERPLPFSHPQTLELSSFLNWTGLNTSIAWQATQL